MEFWNHETVTCDLEQEFFFPGKHVANVFKCGYFEVVMLRSQGVLYMDA